MAEGGLGGILGGEDEGPELDTPEGRAAAQALAASLSIDQDRFDPRVARAAQAFLEAQTAEIAEQRALRLRHLQNQSREGRLRRMSQRLRLGTQVFIILAFTAVAAGFVAMVVNAMQSRSVVVEAFDAPPALAARGLSGKVIAGGLLDELTRLQSAVHANLSKRHLSSAWTGDIKVEVPETGISVGDIDRMLRERLGHDIRISGDLVQDEAGGLALTVRGDGLTPKIFKGGAGDLEKLNTEAAEYIFGQSEPSAYADYLMNNGRSQEVVAFARTAYGTDSKEDRPFLLNTWANALGNIGGSPREALSLYRVAIGLKPDFWMGYGNITNAQLLLQDEEGAWRTGQAMLKAAGGRPGRARDIDYQNLDLLTWNLRRWRSAAMADAESHEGTGSGVATEGVAIADIDARLHDQGDAEFQLKTAQAADKDPTVGAMTHFVHGRLASEAGDAPRALAEMEAFQAGYANPVVSSNFPGYTCWVAPAEEAAGHPDEADAVLRSSGRYVDCFRFRGDILDHRGDWAGAQRAYAAAVAIAPDLPAAYYSWGLALARHGDLAGAVAKLQAAHQRGPNWADPLKAWGDVLLRQGDRRGATRKYEEALRDAPAWADLQHARALAARNS